MRAARKSAVAIIAGLATTISVIGTAGSAMAAETRAPSETAAKTASVGTAIKDPSVKVPQVKQVTQPKYTASKGGVSAASTTTCYTYSNGRGDLCQWYLPNYGQSRGASTAPAPTSDTTTSHLRLRTEQLDEQQG